MLSGALAFLIETAFGLFVVALLLRFYLQWARAPLRNPLSEFLQALTDFMVRPARRIIPGLGGFDLATLVLAWLVQFAELAILLQLRDAPIGSQAGVALAALMLLALVMLARMGVYLLIGIVVIQVILSWVSPHSPLMPLAASLARPLLRPFQRRVPPIGNVDLSPLFALVVLQLLLMLPIAWLEAAASGLLLAG